MYLNLPELGVPSRSKASSSTLSTVGEADDMPRAGRSKLSLRKHVVSRNAGQRAGLMDGLIQRLVHRSGHHTIGASNDDFFLMRNKLLGGCNRRMRRVHEPRWRRTGAHVRSSARCGYPSNYDKGEITHEVHTLLPEPANPTAISYS